MRRKFSIFENCNIIAVESLDGSPLSEAPHIRVQIESVYYKGDDPETDAPVAMYILIDGKRMAKRANCRWISMARKPPHTTQDEDEIPTEEGA
jgi:hypothetical protein